MNKGQNKKLGKQITSECRNSTRTREIKDVVIHRITHGCQQDFSKSPKFKENK